VLNLSVTTPTIYTSMFKKSNHIKIDLLVTKYYQGEPSALPALIRLYHPTLQRLVMYHTNSKEYLDDISQDCWIDIIRFLERADLKIRFEAIAYTIIRRNCIDWIRKQQSERRKKAQIESMPVSQDSEDTDLKESRLDAIHRGIVKLPQTQRIILTLFYLENNNLREISKILQIPKGTVKSRLFTARESLKKIINP